MPDRLSGSIQRRRAGGYQHDFSGPRCNPDPEDPADWESGIEIPVQTVHDVLATDYDATGTWPLVDGPNGYGEFEVGRRFTVAISRLADHSVPLAPLYSPEHYNRASLSGDCLQGTVDADYAGHDNIEIVAGVPGPGEVLWGRGIMPAGSRLTWDDAALGYQDHSSFTHQDPELDITNYATTFCIYGSNATTAGTSAGTRTRGCSPTAAASAPRARRCRLSSRLCSKGHDRRGSRSSRLLDQAVIAARHVPRVFDRHEGTVVHAVDQAHDLPHPLTWSDDLDQADRTR